LQNYLKNGQAKISKGDATVKEDVQKAINEATADGKKLDVILFSVG